MRMNCETPACVRRCGRIRVRPMIVFIDPDLNFGYYRGIHFNFPRIKWDFRIPRWISMIAKERYRKRRTRNIKRLLRFKVEMTETGITVHRGE